MTARGMTLVETMLAIGMTALVGAGISGMMHVLSNDVAMQHDVRTGVIRAALIQSRLSAYVGRCRCLLDLEDDRCVLWLEDTDGDDAVGAHEVRWINRDATSGAAQVHWLVTENAQSMPVYDAPTDIDWWSELSALQGFTGVQRGTIALAGDLQDMQFQDVANVSPIARRRDAMQRQRLEVAMDLQLSNGVRSHRAGESIRLHRMPGAEAAP